MYAIVEIAGQQFKVEKDQQLFVHRLQNEEGSKVTFDNVLLIDNKGKVNVGAPVIKGAAVSAKVIEHLKGDKVIVFKKKRRKGYKVKNGHRQFLTKIQVESIAESGAKPTAKKAESKAKTESAPKKEAPKADKKVTTSKGDSLELINGIGPVYAKEVKKAGYTTFEQISKLTKADIEKLSKLEGIGEELIDSEDWKGQAKILYGYQKVLDKVGVSKDPGKNNLQEINGIGPEIEKELNSVGIFSFEQLSKLGAKEMEYLEPLTGVTKNLIQTDEWVNQAKTILKDKK